MRKKQILKQNIIKHIKEILLENRENKEAYRRRKKHVVIL